MMDLSGHAAGDVVAQQRYHDLAKFRVLCSIRSLCVCMQDPERGRLNLNNINELLG